ADRDVAVNAFVENEPSEKDSDHGIDIGVSRDLRCGNVLQQPNVSGVADPRSADNQIEDGAEAPRGPDNGHVALEGECKGEIGETGEDDLPGCGTERVARSGLPFLREHGTKRPAQGTSLQRDGPPEFAAAEGSGLH